MAYQSNESGRQEIYVRPFVLPGATGTAAGQWPLSTAGGIMPVWRRDGKELFHLNPEGAMMAAPNFGQDRAVATETSRAWMRGKLVTSRRAVEQGQTVG